MDPHRVLGVPVGASEDEIKRAYRALAKRHHPDARQGSVARFLQVQDAYEALVAPGPRRPGNPPAPRDERPARRPAQPGGRSREGGDPTAPGAGGPPAGAAWARGPRGDGTRRSDGQGAGPEEAAGRRGAAGPQHASDPGGRRGSDASPRGRRPGGRRRATLGSTSYDEAEELFEPGWAGASWYGPTSGTYWTVNPKEYADPRKHGPEYQARARSRSVRSTRGAGGGEQGRDGGEHGPGAGEQRPDPHPPDAAAPSPEARAPRPDATAPRAHAWAPRPATATRPPISDELAEERPGLSARLAMALLGWAVPGVALAAAAGFPGGLLATLPLQVAGVVALAAAPRAAWATAAGGVVLVIAALPIVALVSALGGPIAPGQPASPVAVALAVTAWAAGVLLSGSGRLAPYPWPAEP
jgi:curved DNA-binding protein CbpA